MLTIDTIMTITPGDGEFCQQINRGQNVSTCREDSSSQMNHKNILVHVHCEKHSSYINAWNALYKCCDNFLVISRSKVCVVSQIYCT